MSFFAVILWVVVVLLFPGDCHGSRPVPRVLTGCVVEGQFYSVSLREPDMTPVHAYRIRIVGSLDLSPYEGKTITLTGMLSPGDRFNLKPGTEPLVLGAVCSPSYLKVITRGFIFDYVVAAHKEAEKKKFGAALTLIDKAFAIDPGDCQTYIDRAYVYYLAGDFEAGRRDVRTVTTRSCANTGRLNFLIMEDVGKILRSHGKRDEALELYEASLAACRSTICSDKVKKDIDDLKASGKEPRRNP